MEVVKAQLFAREMVLRAQMERLWNPPVAGPQEQFGVLELAGTARIGQARAAGQLVDGVRLVEQLPGTLAALQAGLMYRETAVLLLQQTRNCTAEVTREVERRALPTITTANTTEVRRLLSSLIPEVEADLDPELTERRLADARAGRSVWQADHGDGLVATIGQCDAVSAKRWMMDFEELVRAQKVADDRAGIVRSADQRRADVFSQLPSRLLALLQAIRSGQVEQLLALSAQNPDLADDLEALAASLPGDLMPACDDEPPGDQSPPDLAHEPDRAPHWTDLSLLELASTLMGLPVKNPMVLLVHTPMSTLLELDNRSGRIDQGGALPASLVRLLLPEASLRRVFVDPDSNIPIGLDPTIHPPTAQTPMDQSQSGVQQMGKRRSAKTRPADLDPRLRELLDPFELVDVAEPRHDPSRRLGELIDLRDQTCTGIGCSQPARRCHHDHETAYPQGVTAGWNLSAKSARCHRAKHAGWTVTRHGPGPQHGQTTWTSPLGHSYTRLGAWSRPRGPLVAMGEEFHIANAAS